MAKKRDKTDRLMGTLRTQANKVVPIATEMILPNNSGDHQKSIKRNAPINGIDLVNKEYVDTLTTNHAHQDVRTTATPGFTGLGIGSPTLDAKVHIKHNAINTLKLQRDSTTAGTSARLIFGISTADEVEQAEIRAERVDANSANLIFSTDADVLTMLSGGNVGFGTPSPAVKVEAVGGVSGAETNLLQLRSNAIAVGTASTLKFVESTLNTSNIGSEIISARTSDDGDADLSFKTADNGSLNTRLMIKNSGKIGAGTSLPIRKVHIVGPDTVGTLLLETDSANTGNDCGLLFKVTTDDSDAYIKAGIFFERDETGAGRGDLHFAVEDTNNNSNVDASDAVMTLTHEKSVSIGTRTPATSAKLDITSTTGALLVPRMTTAQKNALTAVNGMILYDTTLNQMQCYENGGWRQI